MEKVFITKEVLFKLMHSHSRLAQAEYERNPAYNDSHPSAMAEVAVANDLHPNVIVEYHEYVDRTEGKESPYRPLCEGGRQ